MSSPASTTSPRSGSSSPATMRSTVLLPQPDGPRSERNSPGAASSETSSTATTRPKVFRSRRTARDGSAALTAGAARLTARVAPGRRSPRDLAPPALRPLRELLRDEVRVGEVHALHEVAVGHELGQIGRQLDRLVGGSRELRLSEAELAFGREQRGDVLLREVPLLARLGHGDGRHDADG